MQLQATPPSPFQLILRTNPRDSQPYRPTRPVPASFTILSLLFQPPGGETEACRNTGLAARPAKHAQNKPNSQIQARGFHPSIIHAETFHQAHTNPPCRENAYKPVSADKPEKSAKTRPCGTILSRRPQGGGGHPNHATRQRASCGITETGEGKRFGLECRSTRTRLLRRQP